MDNCDNTTNSTGNSSCVLNETKLSVNFLSSMLFTLQIILVLFILIGNGLIIAAIKQTHTLRNVSFYFIANMAIADILFGVALALRLVFVLTNSLHTEACVSILILATATGLASATAIVFLCLESYLAVRHIVIFRTALTPRVALIFILLSWLLWIIFSSSMLIHPQVDNIPASQCTYAHPFFNRWYLMALWIMLVIIMIVVFILQGLTCMHLQKHSQGMLQGVHQGKAATDQQKLLKRVRSMTQLIALILLAFLVTWGPYIVALIIHTVCTSCMVKGQHFVYLTLIITLNSVCNVLLYAFKSKDLRNAFVKMLPCCKKRIHIIPGTSVLPDTTR